MAKESSYFTLKNEIGKHDMKTIKQELDKLDGILSVSVNIDKSLIAVDYDNSGADHQRIQNKINNLGFETLKASNEEHVM